MTWWKICYEFELDSDDENDALRHVITIHDEPTSIESEDEENDE